jgi:hypothetical protein
MAMLPDVTAAWPAVLTAATLAIVAILLRRTVFSPISSVPGPFLASVTRFWHVRRILAGDQNVQISKLHEKHGKCLPLRARRRRNNGARAHLSTYTHDD